MYVPQLNIGTGKLELVNVPDGIPLPTVSVPTGAGYQPLGSTPFGMVSTNNTTRRVSFVVEHNEALASLQPPLASPLAFYIARLNNGSQSIQSMATGITVAGATPQITGTLVSGVGFRATLNANGSVSIELAKDAVTARSAKLRYWFSDPDTQSDP